MPTLARSLLCRPQRYFSSTAAAYAPVQDIHPSIKAVQLREKGLHVEFDDHKTSLFHLKWLRDHCPCPTCKHEDTKQRQIDTWKIPAQDITKMSVNVPDSAEAIQVDWSDDLHKTTQHACATSEFPLEFLIKYRDLFSTTPDAFEPFRNSHYRQHSCRNKHLWDGSVQVPTVEYEAYLHDLEAETEAMRQLNEYGILRVVNTPHSIDKVQEFAEKIGFVMETLYGKMWTTKPENEDQTYNDTASTNLELNCHTDGTYMRDPPALQLFNCTLQAHTGGESRFVDGFLVAQKLKEQHPQAYDFFTKTPLMYECFDEGTHLQTIEPLIKLDYEGNIVQFRHNDYDRGALVHLTPDEIDQFYTYHQQFMDILRDPAMEKILLSQPGDMTIVDNQRVMHGRLAFEGSRALVGCYMGRNEYDSRLRMLGII